MLKENSFGMAAIEYSPGNLFSDRELGALEALNLFQVPSSEYVCIFYGFTEGRGNIIGSCAEGDFEAYSQTFIAATTKRVRCSD